MELADAFEDLEKCNPFMLKIEGKLSRRAPRDRMAFAAAHKGTLDGDVQDMLAFICFIVNVPASANRVIYLY